MDAEEALRAGVLHVTGPSHWHNPVFIVGDRLALERLHSLIADALLVGSGDKTFFPHDGEGFALHVRCVDAAEMETVPIGYTDRDLCPSEPWPAWMRHAR